MPRLKTVKKRVFRIEGFEVAFRHPDGRNMRGDHSGVPQYEYRRAARDNMTVATWKNQRFSPNYAGFEIEVRNGEGESVPGKTLLSTVRDSY